MCILLGIRVSPRKVGNRSGPLSNPPFDVAHGKRIKSLKGSPTKPGGGKTNILVEVQSRPRWNENPPPAELHSASNKTASLPAAPPTKEQSEHGILPCLHRRRLD